MQNRRLRRRLLCLVHEQIDIVGVDGEGEGERVYIRFGVGDEKCC